jgi:hypothetical protein
VYNNIPVYLLFALFLLFPLYLNFPFFFHFFHGHFFLSLSLFLPFSTFTIVLLCLIPYFLYPVIALFFFLAFLISVSFSSPSFPLCFLQSSFLLSLPCTFSPRPLSVSIPAAVSCLIHETSDSSLYVPLARGPTAHHWAPWHGDKYQNAASLTRRGGAAERMGCTPQTLLMHPTPHK